MTSGPSSKNVDVFFHFDLDLKRSNITNMNKKSMSILAFLIVYIYFFSKSSASPIDSSLGTSSSVTDIAEMMSDTFWSMVGEDNSRMARASFAQIGLDGNGVLKVHILLSHTHIYKSKKMCNLYRK